MERRGCLKKGVIVQYLFKKMEAKVKYNYLNKANNLNKNIKGSWGLKMIKDD